MQEPSETTGMSISLYEGVSPARRLQYELPPGKHAKGRQRPLSEKEKARNKDRRVRENRAMAMDRKVIEREFNG